MAVKDILTKPIDRRKITDDAVALLLDDLQGNILKGHGRDHALLIFLRFRSRARAKAKQWIAKFAKRVTSAKKQFEEIDDFRCLSINGGLFVNLFLTAKGYQALGVKPPDDRKFIAGMKRSQATLNDPKPQGWDKEYRGDIHALILLAHHHELELDREVHSVLQEVRECADVIAGERGRAIQNNRGETVEHFGYVDGRSQPLLLQEDIREEQDKKDLDPSAVRYNPSAGLGLVLVQDPNGKGELSFGSYLVFRKLEQNVHGFKEAEEKLAENLGFSGHNEERAGALVVGRFEDGTPIVFQRTEGLHNPIPNNFNYKDDPKGDRCPLQAHIRQVNPREANAQERNHRIVRRGITYGERNEDLEDRPEKEVGLLFMCFQSDIENQFEFLQRRANGGRGTNIDPVIGQVKKKFAGQQWPTTWDGPRRKPFPFANFVTLKGGEYFFAPSISGLIRMVEQNRHSE